MIEGALSEDLQEVHDGISPAGARRLQFSPFPPPADLPFESNTYAELDIPEWLSTPPKIKEVSGSVRASNAGVKFRENFESKSHIKAGMNSRERGALVHKLLELLPEIPAKERFSRAMEFLNVKMPRSSEDFREKMANEALKTLDLADISVLFGPNSHAEVDIIGEIQIGRDDQVPRQAEGRIDRLAILEDTVIIGDFKTTGKAPATAEEIPDTILGQLAVYSALVANLYPDRKLLTYVIYTAVPQAIAVPDELLKKALSLIE
jgi:ATP-dependent helicase/nuclease subunit A